MAAQLGLEPDIVKPADINDSFRWFPRADDATSTGAKNAPAALQPSQPAPPLALEANPFERHDMA